MNPMRIYVVHLVMAMLPPTRCFGIKRSLLRWAGAEIGANVRIVSTARFFTTGRLALGPNTWVGHDALIIGGDADIIIGANVDIAPRVSIVSGTHELFTTPDRAAGKGYALPINIADGVWIGTGATVLGGTSIGECAVVAAGALVRKEVGPRTIVSGVPAHPHPRQKEMECA